MSPAWPPTQEAATCRPRGSESPARSFFGEKVGARNNKKAVVSAMAFSVCWALCLPLCPLFFCHESRGQARRARPLRSANSLPLERRRMKNRAMRRPQWGLLRRKGGRPATVAPIGEASPGTLGRRHRLWGGGKQNKKPLFAAKRSQRKRQRQRGGCAPNILPNAKRSKQVEIGSKRLGCVC